MTSLKSGKINCLRVFFNHRPFVFCFAQRTHLMPSASSASTGLGRNGSRVSLHTVSTNREIVNSRWPTRGWTKITIGRKEKKEDKTAVMKILMKFRIQRMMQIHQMKALTRIWWAFILVLIISFRVHLQPLKKQKTRVIVWYVLFLGHLIGDSCWIWSLSANRRRF